MDDRTEIATRLLQARVTATSRELTRLPHDEEQGAVAVTDRLLAELARTAPKASEGEATIALNEVELAALLYVGTSSDTLADVMRVTKAAERPLPPAWIDAARRIIAAGKP